MPVNVVKIALGETDDPKKLVPGSPEAVEADAKTLSSNGASMADVGEGLKAVDTGNWTGEASSSFTDSFFEQPAKWLRTSAAVAAASNALGRYASTLRWAQKQAAEAIAVWEEGEAATKEARSEYDKAVAEAPADAGVPSFSDPGEAHRDHAEYLLAEARKQVEEAAGDAVMVIVGPTIADALGIFSDGQGILGGGKGAFGDLMDTAINGWDAEGKADFTGPSGFESQFIEPGLGTLGMYKLSQDTFHGTADGSVTNGSLKLSGLADVYGGVRTTVTAGANEEGAGFTLEGSSGLRAVAEGRAELGPAGQYRRASGFLGAEGRVNRRINYTKDKAGFDAGAEAFLGAKGTVAGGFEAAGVDAGVTAEGWSGIGAEVDANFGWNGEKREVKLGGKLGGAFGVGGAVHGEFSLNYGKFTDTAKDAAGLAGDVARGTANTIKDGARSLRSSIDLF
ncbi:putative T7SS-secreted protein [Streptomyces cucumeris]|uniref:putative T7SS-secreted protein n=1 Tax=Streptomyces cucumeris TaxID=2962890 RepID=UPI003D747AB9